MQEFEAAYHNMVDAVLRSFGRCEALHSPLTGATWLAVPYYCSGTVADDVQMHAIRVTQGL